MYLCVFFYSLAQFDAQWAGQPPQLPKIIRRLYCSGQKKNNLKRVSDLVVRSFTISAQANSYNTIFCHQNEANKQYFTVVR